MLGQYSAVPAFGSKSRLMITTGEVSAYRNFTAVLKTVDKWSLMLTRIGHG
jgi:hypothetical protein